MKHVMKWGSIISVAVLFCAIGVWIEAVDISGTYQRAKDAASSVKDKVVSTATTVKDTVGNVLSSASRALIRSEQKAIANNPYKNTVASVRIGNGLHPEERAYLAKRKPKVKSALEKLLGRSLTDKQVPTIAMIGSGGGYRAMLGTTAFLNGAEKIGLLGAVTYITALSGSTWALNPWLTTGMPLSQFKSYIAKSITEPIYVKTIAEAKNIVDMLSVKVACDQPITMIDVYGGLLANRLLSYYGSDCQRVHMSDQAARIKNGDYPYPIYSAIDAREAVARDPHWFEFTPHEIGSPYFGVYVPTWGYGRQFNNGQSTDFSPEQSLGFMMGTFGSAFGVHFGRAWDEVSAKMPDFLVKPIIEKQLFDPYYGKRTESFWAEVHNFMFGMTNQELTSRPTLKFVDAGIHFNLPYPPVSGQRPERKADILIFLDSSKDSIPAAIKKCEEYARKRGLKYPPMDYSEIDKKTISVFKDENDPSVPVVIYLPRVSDPEAWAENKSKREFNGYTGIDGFDMEKCAKEGFCKTSNFQYTEQQSQQVLDQLEFNMIINKDKIIEAINWVVDRR